ncbi:hypothetical protein [Halorussus sp. MSC15.2]|uniref:hypothetical protein n=1 Tax=Halorussus sp. MSC15.2 TaxID=2283638 RepID=UPI0013D66035|nr:hypothetical protein [Halorussus sp. MSC15.2]NEU58156.1 hypothetical protein [Halorussus sp. MSC15.2]
MDSDRIVDVIFGLLMIKIGAAPLASVALGQLAPEDLTKGLNIHSDVFDSLVLLMLVLFGSFLIPMGVITIKYGRSNVEENKIY